MTAKNLTVRKNKANNATATELALMVTSGTDLTIEPYDQNAIVKSLKEELGLSTEVANEIANEVTEKLLLVCKFKGKSCTGSTVFHGTQLPIRYFMSAVAVVVTGIQRNA